MFTGTKTGGGDYLKTGLTGFQFLGVNPTAAQIGVWTGREDVKDPNYDIVDDYNKEHQVRNINIWLKNIDAVVTNFRIQVSLDEAIANSGNYQVCTSNGSVLWAKSGGVVKPEFAGHKALKIGEADWIQFVAKLINFDYKSGENLYQQLVDQKLDVDSLYAGNYTGVNNLVKWAAENDKLIAMVLVVREKDVMDDKGNQVTRQYQAVASASETWFHGLPNDWAEGKLLERYEKSLEVGVGQTKAYPIIKELFTIKYQPFSKAECFNLIPNNPEIASATWNS
jgi:hypothetical protein